MARRNTKTRSGPGRRARTEGLMLRKKSRYLEGVKDIDIRDVEFLRKFMTDHGKIMPSRMTGANAKQQRLIRQGIRRARQMGLLA